MTPFTSVVVVKQPLEALWTTIRDRMPAIAERVDDIERVTVVSREDRGAGIVHLVNEWRITPSVPLPESIVAPGTLGWLDHATWTDADRTCRWEIRTLFLEGKIRCSGVTTYEPAMGSRGTRVTFSGEIELQDALPLGGLLGRAAIGVVESVVTTIVPRNFRTTVETAVRMLDAEAAAG